MKLDPRPPKRHQHQNVTQKPGFAAGFLVVALFLGGIVLISDLYPERPDYYEPVRSSLVVARLHLKASYERERDLLKQVRSAHRELETAIRFIEQADHTEPADRKELAALRERVGALGNDQKTEQMTADELLQTYQALIEDIDTMIRKHE